MNSKFVVGADGITFHTPTFSLLIHLDPIRSILDFVRSVKIFYIFHQPSLLLWLFATNLSQNGMKYHYGRCAWYLAINRDVDADVGYDRSEAIKAQKATVPRPLGGTSLHNYLFCQPSASLSLLLMPSSIFNSLFNAP